MRVLGTLLGLLLGVSTASGDIVREVRAAIARQDLAAAESALAAYRQQKGDGLEAILALSWLGRGALAARDFDKAEAYAQDTRELVLAQLKTRELDAERRLPLALGASIEVQAEVLAARKQRAEAISFLQQELKTYYGTSIRTRIQKNIHQLSLEGKAAPSLETRLWLGAPPPGGALPKGRPMLLFFWAHWCGDCKAMAPSLKRIGQDYETHGLLIVAPTQRYGYVARGEEASPEVELNYIERIRQEHFPALEGAPIPVSEENFRLWGVSSTPTLALADRNGVVRLYHPGEMRYEELAAGVERLFGSATASPAKK